MKQKDIAMILVIGFVSAVLSLLASNFLFGAKSRNLTAEKVDPISADFATPDQKHFNSDAVDPTRTIRIGTDTNPTPFQ